jgi:hypothetical protein
MNAMFRDSYSLKSVNGKTGGNVIPTILSLFVKGNDKLTTLGYFLYSTRASNSNHTYGQWTVKPEYFEGATALTTINQAFRDANVVGV